MPRRTNEFQSLVMMIEKAVAAHGTKVTESLELHDKIIGEDREVDIVIEATDGARNLIVSIRLYPK